MEFRILGPLEVTERGQPLAVSGQQRRLLLAAFLLHPNRPLSTQQLRSWLWADNPADVRNAMHTALSKLRRSLKPTHPAAADVLHTVRRPIHAHETGYQLAADADQLDSLRFARLTADARTALAADRGNGNGDRGLEHAAGALREALALWRGDQVLQGLHLPEPLRSEADRLQRLRLDALETRIDTDLALDRHADLLAELDALVAAHPDHERFHAQLMLARYRSGRQVAALGAYQAAYRTLVDRYGVEPSPQLQRLQQQILARDPILDSPAQTARRAGRPYDLPPPPPQLVGRDRAGDALEAMLTAAGPAPVIVVHGAAGAGKTALAVATAHRLRARFPHGVILADLRGSTDRPAGPEALLGHILDALGARHPAATQGLQALTLRMRTLLADRRVLLVLDDAAAEQQVRPLLPATPTSAVVVTSRTPLHALPATGTLALGPLDPRDAVTLLGVSIHPLHGAARAQAEPDAAQEVARRCGHLPLALWIAGGKLAARPSWTLRTLAARLRDRGLDELRLGDLDLRAALDASYARLTAAQQRTLRLLALVDGLDVAPWTVTALLGGAAPSGDLLDELVDAHLLEYGEGGRYRLPEPFQRYAAERLAREEPDGVRDAARDRFLHACLEVAAAAAASRPPARLPRPAGVATPRRPRRSPAAGAHTDPRGVLAAERDVLHAAVRQAHATGRWALTWQIAQPLLRGCDATDRWDDWWQLAALAVDAARQSGDATAQAAALASLGRLLTARGQLP